MTLKAGIRLRTPASACEVMVIRAVDVDEVLTCAGGVMSADGSECGAGAASNGPTIQLGKRYVDEESGLEVLCVKAGLGPLALGDRELTLKANKPLPASD